jgi:hypothetical protein
MAKDIELRTSRNITHVACSGDPLVDHAVMIMDLSGFHRKISRRMIATVLFEVRKRGTFDGPIANFVKEIKPNINYTKIAMIILQEFGLVVHKQIDSSRHVYYLDEDRLRNPVAQPINLVRRKKYDGNYKPPESEPKVVAKIDKVTPRTRCVECGAKVTEFSIFRKYVCLACDLRGKKKTNRDESRSK